MSRGLLVSGLAALMLGTAEALGNATTADDAQALKAKVMGAKVFQEKLTALCEETGDMEGCKARASDLLFCRLLSRNRPDTAVELCAAIKPRQQLRRRSFAEVGSRIARAPQPSMDDLKRAVYASEAFQKQAQQMSLVLGCKNVKKVDDCKAYVQDAAFCLAFAERMGSFTNRPGYQQEADHCKSIDTKLPELSMLLQRKAAGAGMRRLRAPSFIQLDKDAPEEALAKEMTHDLQMNFNKIAPFGKEDTAKELQDHAAKTQDTLVDAVENAEVAEIKRAVFRALTRLRAATIKEFDTIARLETQAIDAYNDAHHYRGENPLAHLHEDEAPVETDKLKSFH
eukprot:CAMPEP_0176085312 /NCGR_PEP_ID=MMETSP0120_2-20121206/42697_1 /TAXON_ID=160619 /ORGANISM="Kryptoperidinium foliaceum, Strain CCMP 1326" /LENGTH=339 /DNA_ID=CAMNT_0017419127 /DNA_START=56 /DNA_END=1075 /DNA_ORIENTATION=-